MISNEIMNYVMEVAVISFVAPVVLLMIWRLRTRKNLLPALAGAVMFLGFAKLLAVIPNTVFLGMWQPVAKLLNGNAILYALYTGIVAAILEETARYLAFRYLLPKYGSERETAVTYGIGHGGMECMVSYGITNLLYYVTATVLNGSADVIQEFPKETFEEVTSLTLFDCALDSVSAILFLILQIGLSVFMFQAYRNPTLCKRLFGFSMLFHALAYLPNGFYKAGLLSHVLAVVLLAVTVVLQIYVAIVIYKKMGDNERKLQKEKAVSSHQVRDVATKKLTGIEDDTSKSR